MDIGDFLGNFGIRDYLERGNEGGDGWGKDVLDEVVGGYGCCWG